MKLLQGEENTVGGQLEDLCRKEVTESRWCGSVLAVRDARMTHSLCPLEASHLFSLLFFFYSFLCKTAFHPHLIFFTIKNV